MHANLKVAALFVPLVILTFFIQPPAASATIITCPGRPAVTLTWSSVNPSSCTGGFQSVYSVPACVFPATASGSQSIPSGASCDVTFNCKSSSGTVLATASDSLIYDASKIWDAAAGACVPPTAPTCTQMPGTASCATYAGQYGIPPNYTVGTASYTYDSCTLAVTYISGCSAPAPVGSAIATVTVTVAAACPASYTDQVVTGSTSGGTVWGSGPYTDNSNLSMVTVHQGLLTPGQTGTIHRTSSGSSSNYLGTTRNGVTTSPYGLPWCGVTLSLVSLSLPDLTADDVPPTTATRNVAAIFNSTINNVGSVGTGAAFNNFMQVATNPNGGGTITDTASVNMAALANGSSRVFSKSYTFPASGSYSVRVCADKSSSGNAGTIVESNEGNNCGSWTNIVVSNSCVANQGSSCTSAANSCGQTTSGGTIQCNGSCSATPPPDSNCSTVTLWTTPSIITSGQSSNLTWTSTNAVTCTALGGFGVSYNGTATSNDVGISTGPLTSSQSYQIACMGLGGPPVVNSNIATVTVLQPQVSIDASPIRVQPGGSSTITWSSSEVSSCTVSGPGLSSTNLSGSQAVTISSRSTYTITCDAFAPKSVTVNVTSGFQEF